MAKNPIRKEEILNTFLVTSRYGEPGGWPHETVAVCKIIDTDVHGNKLLSHRVYRNYDQHAEEMLIKDLEKNPPVQNSKRKIWVYQNYSPCCSCAGIIIAYVQAVHNSGLGNNVEITITFANFYKTHEYFGNSLLDAKYNIVWLNGLNSESGVELRLFGIHLGWERFLGMNQFFHLTEDEKNECLDKAESPGRKDRERQDQKVWDDIFGFGRDITSGLQNLSIQ